MAPPHIWRVSWWTDVLCRTIVGTISISIKPIELHLISAYYKYNSFNTHASGVWFVRQVFLSAYFQSYDEKLAYLLKVLCNYIINKVILFGFF